MYLSWRIVAPICKMVAAEQRLVVLLKEHFCKAMGTNRLTKRRWHISKHVRFFIGTRSVKPAVSFIPKCSMNLTSDLDANGARIPAYECEIEDWSISTLHNSTFRVA